MDLASQDDDPELASRAPAAHSGQRPKLGKYFLVQGPQVRPKVNLEELARELGCMEPWETLEKG
jgi:hypothetical protein